MTIHRLKLSVGSETIEDLADWQTRQMQRIDNPVHHTRMSPKRAEEMLDGGSIYWVIKRAIRVRQRIIDIRAIKDEGGRWRCTARPEDGRRGAGHPAGPGCRPETGGRLVRSEDEAGMFVRIEKFDHFVG